MTMTTGRSRLDGAGDRTFHALVSTELAAPADTDAERDRSTAMDELLSTEPTPPRASLITVVILFLAIAATQVGVLAVSAVSFELPTVRLILGLTVGAPATLYAIVAAWDHRQLTGSGDAAAPRWEWAVIFPPAYLAVRLRRLRTSRRDRVADLPWALAQLLVTVAFIVIAVTALVTSPQVPAGAAPVDDTGVIVDDTGVIAASDIASQVERGWADTGDSGTVSCPEPLSQTPGTTIDCTAVYGTASLVFTAEIGDVATGEPRIIIARWSEVAAG